MWSFQIFMRRTILSFSVFVLLAVPHTTVAQSATEEMAAVMGAVNAQLEATGADYRVALAEFITTEGEEMANTVLAKDVGNKQVTEDDFVPFDARRVWTGAGGSLTYAVDTTIDAVPPLGGLTQPETDAAIVRAVNTWDALQCSMLGLARNPDFGLDIGVLAFLLGLGGTPFTLADIQYAGWRDIDFIDPAVLGVTFTFWFIDPVSGLATDIDHNGKHDTAFREIYFDPSFLWADDGVTNVDVETVALHETGHGLSQAHFGMQSVNQNGLILAPAAVMNAIYTRSQRTLLGTDIGGHCTGWGRWPTN